MKRTVAVTMVALVLVVAVAAYAQVTVPGIERPEIKTPEEALGMWNNEPTVEGEVE